MNRPRFDAGTRLAGRSGQILLTICVVMSGCEAPPQTGQAQADAETRAACQERASEAYNQRNRAEIYSPPPTVNTPYSANYVPAMSDRGLSDLFVNDRMVSDCVRNTGTGEERAAPAPVPAPLPLPPPPPPHH
jgi:hypothetical protein